MRKTAPAPSVSTSVEELLRVALARGSAAATGRLLVTFNEGAMNAGMKSLRVGSGLRIADARDSHGQAFALEQASDADGVVYPEIGVALVGGESAAKCNMSVGASSEATSPIRSIDPEYFMFADQAAASGETSGYLQGFARMTRVIQQDLGILPAVELQPDVEPEVSGATWGLTACKVTASTFDGNGIKVAILGTGFDLGHPEFASRTFVTSTFVGQPVQDGNGHGTHVAGTACGPKAPAGGIPRYGIGFQTSVFIAKVLTNQGVGTQAQVLAGMNWAIANKCQVIIITLGAGIAVQPSYTAAGAAALTNGCLMFAPSGHGSHRPGFISPVGAPANSPTVVSVGSLDADLKLAAFSSGGKIDIAAPGVNVVSSFPRPVLHKTWSGSACATAHAAGCAALFAQVSSALRGQALREKLFAAAERLPFPATDAGAGLVQAP